MLLLKFHMWVSSDVKCGNFNCSGMPLWLGGNKFWLCRLTYWLNLGYFNLWKKSSTSFSENEKKTFLVDFPTRPVFLHFLKSLCRIVTLLFSLTKAKQYWTILELLLPPKLLNASYRCRICPVIESSSVFRWECQCFTPARVKAPWLVFYINFCKLIVLV